MKISKALGRSLKAAYFNWHIQIYWVVVAVTVAMAIQMVIKHEVT